MLLQDFSFADGKYIGSPFDKLESLYRAKNTKFRLASPDSIPSRVSFLSGKFPASIGVHGHDGKRNTLSQATPPTIFENLNGENLFSLLREAGYE